MTRILKAVGLMIGALTVILSFMGLLHRTVREQFKEGGFLQITPASFWASACGARCTVLYRPREGRSGTIELWQNLVHEPIIFLPGSSDGALLCVYEFDTDIRLIRFDPNLPFSAFPQSSCLAAIVWRSPWQASEADIRDWESAIKCLKDLPSASSRRQA